MEPIQGNVSIDAQNIMPIIKKWLYSDKDIFIREVVSNGCDAITKLRMVDSAAAQGCSIHVEVDKAARELRFIDDGVGMTEDEVKTNINQVAFSGAKSFMEEYAKNEDKENSGIIGHFGLGFYSVFMIADQVTIDTLSFREGATPVRWESEDGMAFTMTEGTRTARGTVYCLTVIGQIEGHSLLPNTVKTTKYEHVLPLLAALDESEEIDGVLLLLNTCGGDVEAGLAIAELIAGMRKPTVSLVLGGGHSIGVPLAVAPKRSLIAPSASMTVHPIRTNGTLIAAPQTYHYFDRLQERIVRFVTKNSGISEKKLLALMLAAEDMAADVGSILYGEEAVADGLIDRVGTLADAYEELYTLIAASRAAAKPRRR